MAHHKSAKKRIRQQIKRHARNRVVLGNVRTRIKELRQAVDEGKKGVAANLLPDTVDWINKGVTKGTFHKNTAARTISRLTRAVAKLS